MAKIDFDFYSEYGSCYVSDVCFDFCVYFDFCPDCAFVIVIYGLGVVDVSVNQPGPAWYYDSRRYGIGQPVVHQYCDPHPTMIP